MSECSSTVESLKSYLPFLDKLIVHMRGSLFVKQFENMKQIIDNRKKLSPDQVRRIETSIVNLQKKINDFKSESSSGFVKQNVNNKNCQMEVIYIDSDEETPSTTLFYENVHAEPKTIKQILTKEAISTNNLDQEIVIKPESSDVQIITSIIQTNNITPDTDSQKFVLKSECCEVETIVREVKLIPDDDGKSQLNNNNESNLISMRIKIEEPESDIEDWKTVYSGSSEKSQINTVAQPVCSQTSDDDEILPPASAKRKRRKISSSSEVSDIGRNQYKRKRRRIVLNSESSDDEKAESTASTNASTKNRNKSNSSSGNEFFSTQSTKSSDTPVKNILSDENLIQSLKNFRETIIHISKDKTVDTAGFISLVKNIIPDVEMTRLISFLRQCCVRGLLSLGSYRSKSNEKVLEDFVNLTLRSDNQISDNSMLDFSNDHNYRCKDSSQRKSKALKKLRHTKKELDKLKEDIDKSFIKPGLLNLKPRVHKKVDYNVDNNSSSSDDSDAFVNSIFKCKPNPSKKKKPGRRRRISSSSSSKSNQHKNDDLNQSDSDIGFFRPLKAKRLEDLESDRTTPDNLESKTIENVKTEDFEDNRSTPDIDLINDPRVVSFESDKYVLGDEEIDTECSSGETIHGRSRNISPLLDEDEDEDENNPVYHFITLKKIKDCSVNISKLNIIHKPKPYRVNLKNGILVICDAKSDEKPAENTKMRNSETFSKIIDDIKPIETSFTIQTISNDKSTLERPEMINIIENHNAEHPNKTVEPSKRDGAQDIEDPQKMQTITNLIQQKRNNTLKDLIYDPISSDSENEFIDMKSNKNVKANNLITEKRDKDENSVDFLPNKNTIESANDLTSTIIEEKFSIQENILYDPISSDSENDALYIDIKAKTKREEDIKKETNNIVNCSVNIQHPVAIIENAASNSVQNKITVKPRRSGILANNQNSTLRENLSKNLNSTNIAEKSLNIQKKIEVLQQTSQKNTAQSRMSQKTTNRMCCPNSKFLTENERKVLNLSFISCRGGYQFRCLNSCKFYSLKEDTFKNHILSKHVLEKWAGFCNLCGNRFSNEVRPLIDEYDHMIKYHIKLEHNQRLNTKENIVQVDEIEKDVNDNHKSDCIMESQ